jgi:hypothetical protein
LEAGWGNPELDSRNPSNPKKSVRNTGKFILVCIGNGIREWMIPTRLQYGSYWRGERKKPYGIPEDHQHKVSSLRGFHSGLHGLSPKKGQRCLPFPKAKPRKCEVSIPSRRTGSGRLGVPQCWLGVSTGLSKVGLRDIFPTFSRSTAK